MTRRGLFGLMLACSSTLVAGPALATGPGLPAVPRFTPASQATTAGLRTCVTGELRLLVDRSGHVRFLEHGHLYPDNRLRVRQSYDHAGRLSGVRVQWSGFAGELLDVRGAFDSRGRLVRETGYRRSGVTTPLRSYLRPLPAQVRC